MPTQVAQKPPAPKRKVHVMERPEPTTALDCDPLASQQLTDAYFQHYVASCAGL